MIDHIKLIWHTDCICCLEFIDNHKLNCTSARYRVVFEKVRHGMSSLEAVENFGPRNSKSSNIILVSTNCSIHVILLNPCSHYPAVLVCLRIFGFHIFFFLFQPSEVNANDPGYNDDYFPTLSFTFSLCSFKGRIYKWMKINFVNNLSAQSRVTREFVISGKLLS